MAKVRWTQRHGLIPSAAAFFKIKLFQRLKGRCHGQPALRVLTARPRLLCTWVANDLAQRKQIA